MRKRHRTVLILALVVSMLVIPVGAIISYQHGDVNGDGSVNLKDVTALHRLWSTDTFTVIAEQDGLAQIIYPLDSGGYKMGWISLRTVTKN